MSRQVIATNCQKKSVLSSQIPRVNKSNIDDRFSGYLNFESHEQTITLPTQYFTMVRSPVTEKPTLGRPLACHSDSRTCPGGSNCVHEFKSNEHRGTLEMLLNCPNFSDFHQR